jgi:hypothetical protein
MGLFNIRYVDKLQKPQRITHYPYKDKNLFQPND